MGRIILLDCKIIPTEQLRHCFPNVKNYADKKKIAAAMNEKQLLQVLFEVQKSPTKLWLASEVRDVLVDRSDLYLKQIETSEFGFADELLAFVTPKICWCCKHSGSAGLLIEEKHFFNLCKLSKNPFKAYPAQKDLHHLSCCFLEVPESKLLDFLERIDRFCEQHKVGQIPATHSFNALIEDLKNSGQITSAK